MKKELPPNPREYRVLRLKKGELSFFYNKHKKEFIPTTKELPSRINNHIGLKDALTIIKENENNFRPYIDYI